MLIDPEPLLPTRGYRVLSHEATLIDLLESTVTTLVTSCRGSW